VYAYIVHRLGPADACSLAATRDLARMRIVKSVGHGGGGLLGVGWEVEERWATKSGYCRELVGE